MELIMKNLKEKENIILYDKEIDKNLISYLKYAITRIIAIVGRLVFSILYLFINPGNYSNKVKYNVSICAIFKNEAPYLKEWIEFHKIVGVEHFYLYNNNSTDEYLEILNPYIKSGIVEIKDWPFAQGQMLAYSDFIKTKSNETKWVGFIDLDEYVVPNKTDNIYDFLKKHENKTSVLMYWRQMGSSGLISRDKDSLITESFILGWKKQVDIAKFFFNTKYNYDFDFKFNCGPHYTWGA